MVHEPAPYRVPIVGAFGIFTAGAIREELTTAFDLADEIEVDLSQVSEIDCTGLQLMIAAQNEAIRQGKHLRFVDHSPCVRDVLDQAIVKTCISHARGTERCPRPC